MMTWSAIVAAAGSGTRLGAHQPKALVELAGSPLIVHAVRGLARAGITDCIVTVPREHISQFEETLAQAGLHPRIVVGGKTRQESVARGLAEVATSAVVVHDAARALTPPEMIARVMAAVEAGATAVVPVLPVVDTIKQVDDDGRVVATLQRAELRAVQTPQGFAVEQLRAAHEYGAKLSASEQSAAPDDAVLVELLGQPVQTVAGDGQALKITTPVDLAIAQLLVASARDAVCAEVENTAKGQADAS